MNHATTNSSISEPITIESMKKAFNEIDIATKKMVRQNALEIIKYGSYFLPSEYIKEDPIMPLAEEITHKVLAEMNGRSGYDTLWNNLDDDTKGDIVTSIIDIVKECIDNALRTKSLVCQASLLNLKS